MKVVRHQRVRQDFKPQFVHHVVQEIKEEEAILITEEDLSARSSPVHDVVPGSRKVYAGTSRHNELKVESLKLFRQITAASPNAPNISARSQAKNQETIIYKYISA
jgi:uncharacterized membrane protein